MLRKDRLVVVGLRSGLVEIYVAVVLVVVGIVRVVEWLVWNWHLKSQMQRTTSSLA